MFVDEIRFAEACERVKTGQRLISGIGTVSEGTVHAVLKNYYEPYTDSQEQSIGGYIADIVGEKGIVEIQTGKFGNLSQKLKAFLNAAHVTIVYPIYTTKIMVNVDGETGEVLRRRKSPIHDAPEKIFRELFPISEFLLSERLSIDIVSLEVDEIRISAAALGKKPRRGGRLSVYDRVPTRLMGITEIASPRDWAKLLPCIYETDFTAVDAAKYMSSEYASAAVGLLYRGGILERTGKKGRAYTYSLKTTLF